MRAPGAAWATRRHLGYTADVLRHAACATCSLGSRGLRDDVRPGLHLCRRRLDDLARVVADPMGADALGRADLLDRAALRALGRLSLPLLRRHGGRFEPLSWEDATNMLAARLQASGGGWAMHVGDEELSNEDAWMLARLGGALGTSGITRRGATSTPWRRALKEATGLAASPSTLSDLPEAERIVLWGPVLSTHPELARWLPRRADILTVGSSLPGQRQLLGEAGPLALRGVAAAWRARSPELVVGRPPSAVPEPALAQAALHLVDASLQPEPLIALALLQGALGRTGAGLVVLGDQPGVADMGLDGDPPPQETDVVVCVGDARPPRQTARASFRVHLGWFADPAMLVEPAGEVLVLPLRWRFETPGGTTTTSADRVIRYSAQVLGHDVAQARALPRILGQVLRRCGIEAPADATEARRALAAVVPEHGPVAGLQRPGEWFQWGGPQPLAERFRTPDGRGRVPSV